MPQSTSQSTATVLEMVPLEYVVTKTDYVHSASSHPPEAHWSTSGRSLRSLSPGRDVSMPDHPVGSTASSLENGDPISLTTALAITPLEKWWTPRINIYRIAACFYGFFVMGMNDASYGPIIPYLEEAYDLSYTVVSLIFLSPFIGYTLAAVLNNSVHLRWGQRGVAILGPSCHTITYILLAAHPPYPVLVVAFAIGGLGNGFLDSAWNAWLGAMDHANEILGFLHGFYGLGATLAPLIATSIITKADRPWYVWYYVMLGAAVVEMATSVYSFRAATGAAFRAANVRMSEGGGSRLVEALFKRPAARVTWLVALFLLGDVGAEVALGGWIVTFMIRVRHGAAFASGMTATGFWLGLTVGRVVLGFVTPRLGESLAISIYLPLACGLQLLFWLVPQFYVSAVAVALVGFFTGPLFPAAMVACTKFLPKHLHVSAIGFAAACGGSGGAIFPFAVGAIAQAKGVQVLQPIIVALFAIVWLLWLCLPRMNKKRD